MTGIYIHIPFCIKKCSYCDFISLPFSLWGNGFVKVYLEALKTNIKKVSFSFKDKPYVDTIFIGGGTPSILSALEIDNILSFVYDKFKISDKSEVTLESNPKTLNKQKLKDYKKIGINRLSIGVQSLRDKNLSILGRIHNCEDFLKIYKVAQKVNFNSINLDFIYGIPGQTFNMWKKELKEIASLDAPHLSLYNLIPEKNTPLGDKILSSKSYQLCEDEQALMMDFSHNFLENKKYRHYEVSNYSRKGHQCKHNIKYWKSSEYFGFGCGAFSYIAEERYGNIKDPFNFVKEIECGNSIISFSEKLPIEKKMGEFMMMGLRLFEGVSYKNFYSKFNKNIEDVYKKAIQNLLLQGLLKKNINLKNDTYIFIPPEHFKIQNEILQHFIVI